MSDFSMDDYVDVAERIRLFREKNPDGSLQPVTPGEPIQVVEVAGQTFIVYAAAAYRSPEDARPGIALAWEPFPGKTPFTRDSELMNAETGAWGRAIVAALAADTKKVASRDEVENAQHRTERPAPKYVVDYVADWAREAGADEWAKEQNFAWPWTQATCDAIAHYIEGAATPTVEQPGGETADVLWESSTSAVIVEGDSRAAPSEPLPVQPSRVANLRARLSALVADDRSITTRYNDARLPALKQSLKDGDLDAIEAFLDEERLKLEAPFVDAQS